MRMYKVDRAHAVSELRPGFRWWLDGIGLLSFISGCISPAMVGRSSEWVALIAPGYLVVHIGAGWRR